MIRCHWHRTNFYFCMHKEKYEEKNNFEQEKDHLRVDLCPAGSGDPIMDDGVSGCSDVLL